MPGPDPLITTQNELIDWMVARVLNQVDKEDDELLCRQHGFFPEKQLTWDKLLSWNILLKEDIVANKEARAPLEAQATSDGDSSEDEDDSDDGSSDDENDHADSDSDAMNAYSLQKRRDS
ncbi:hypothetical protein EIP86_000264 [Pleurotus ostreatoroseus]|nr:hypothetical protein EIP86_000264 [Pleurotus ostreatoroseus]